MLSILKSLKILIFGNEGSSIFQHVCRLEYDEEENKELKDYQWIVTQKVYSRDYKMHM